MSAAALVYRLYRARRIAASADPALVDLMEEVRAYPLPGRQVQQHLAGEHLGVVMPFKLRTPQGILSFISALTIFGTPNDVTLQELAVESFFPADEVTAGVLRGRDLSGLSTKTG